MLVQKDWEVSEAYRVGHPQRGTLPPDGKVGSPVIGGAEGIRGLLAHAVGSAQRRCATPSPRAALPNCGKVHPNGTEP